MTDDNLQTFIDQVESDEQTGSSPFRNHRTGVVICQCGGRIASRLDTEALRRGAAALPQVAYAACEGYPCSKDGQARLRQAIAEQKLERFLVAGCTPRLVEKLFRQSAESAGLESSYLDVVDIREQCALVHTTSLASNTSISSSEITDNLSHLASLQAQQKAESLIAMGIAHLNDVTPVRPRRAQVVKAALILGSSLAGLTAALSLADNGIHVTLVESSLFLGGQPRQVLPGNLAAQHLLEERCEAALRHSRICTLLSARIANVVGQPGDYEVQVSQAGSSGVSTTSFGVGAILLAADAQPSSLNSARWVDRRRVKTQVEFESELAAWEAGDPLPGGDVLLLLNTEVGEIESSRRLNFQIALQQAIRFHLLALQQPGTPPNTVLLFSDESLIDDRQKYFEELEQARAEGINFFRYHEKYPPLIGEESVDLRDPLAGETMHLPFGRAVVYTPWLAPHIAGQWASQLNLLQDQDGFLVAARRRLRPGRFAEDGIYVLGGSHQPVEAGEAQFQGYLTATRVLRYLSQETIQVENPLAEVDPALCTGCAQCVPTCPTSAIRMTAREIARETALGTSFPSTVQGQEILSVATILSVAKIAPLRCTGCGNCVVACPVKALTLPGWNDAAILAQINAALRQPAYADTLPTRQPLILALACEWSAYAAADMAGARGLHYPAQVRIIRMNCSARFDPAHVLWAFLLGAEGVFLGACPPGQCHYGAGNLFAAQRIENLKQQLAEHGIDPRRLHLEFLPTDDGGRFARAISDFVNQVVSDQALKQPYP